MFVTSLREGYAQAIQPISASAIHTPADGLVAGEVSIPTKDGLQLPGYRAMPATGKTFPIVLVIQEIFGVHEHIRDVCRRLAKEGYLAVAPELFARQGDVSKMTDTQEIIANVVSKVPDAEVLSDLDATVAWAAKTGHGDVSRLGATGFCWGGRAVWLYAAHSSQLKAGAAWYGQIIGVTNDCRTRTALDVAGTLKAPVLGLYGGKDTGIPPEHVDAMKGALHAAGSESEIVVFPKAGHGFNADYRPSYSPEDAKHAWQRMLAWFRKYGVA